MKAIIRQLLAHQSLSKSQCHTLFSDLTVQTSIEQAVILSLLASKQESIEEILAARAFLLPQSITYQLCRDLNDEDLVDIVGTGGDGLGLFNISTAASLLVASCGVRVAKHGGGRISSSSGSSDLIHALKIPTPHQRADILEGLEQCHFVYLQASLCNPAFQLFQTLRKALSFPTIFNLVGPLLNPLQPKRLVIGVYRKNLVPIMASILQQIGTQHAMVVHGLEGLDELSVSGKTVVAEVFPDAIREYTLDPRELGLPAYALSEVLGGNPVQNAELIQSILQGELQGAKRDIVLLNAAAGLLVADKVTTFAEGMDMALDAITSGHAQHLLRRLQVGVSV